MKIMSKSQLPAEVTIWNPFIALTALAMPGDYGRCLMAGANEYMSKPVKLIELKKVIENLSLSSSEA